MRYLIVPKDQPPFFTSWFDVENNYSEGMIVFDLDFQTYTSDGVFWFGIKKDVL